MSSRWRAERLGRLERLDIGGERQFAARGQHRVAQHLADLVAVLLVLVGVVARRLVIEDAAVVVEDVGESGANATSLTCGAGRGKPRRRSARSAPASRHRRASQAGVRQKPMRGAPTLRSTVRCGIADQRRAHQREIVEAAADDARACRDCGTAS